MKKLGIVGAVLLFSAAAVHGQAEFPTRSAGDAFRERSNPPMDSMEVPSLAAEGWEQARVGTVEYANQMKTDIYWPPARSEKPLPFILVAFSYTSAQFIEAYGRPFREFTPVTIWMAQLANRGFIVVCPDVGSSGRDMAALLAWLHARGPSLGGNPARIGLLSFSANPKIIPYMLTLPEAPSIKAVALYYPEVLPAAWPSPSGIALHIIKAGQDSATSKQKADLVAQKFAEAGNHVEVFTYEKGAHAFDLKDRSPEAAAMMAKTLEFFSMYLSF
jgi:hypothetical protein